MKHFEQCAVIKRSAVSVLPVLAAWCQLSNVNGCGFQQQVLQRSEAPGLGTEGLNVHTACTHQHKEVMEVHRIYTRFAIIMRFCWHDAFGVM